MSPRTLTSSLLPVVAGLTLLLSCKKETTAPAVTLTDQEILEKVLTLPPTLLNYADIALPSYINTAEMKEIDNTPADNPVTDEGATLGRVLFYDKLLSANNTKACASCHRQENSFADPVRFSTGFDNGKTSRNSMTLVNARYYQPGSFFWDQRAASLEEQVLEPIQNSVEMGLTLDELESKLSKQDYYKILFRRAFGDTVITRSKVALALAQFVRSLVSCRSKFDEGVAVTQAQTDEFANFSPEENRGKQLFLNHCGGCHGTALQLASEARSNGLDLVYTDNGVGDVTKNEADKGKFKAPSLRNVAVTAPYMHDGRFSDLAQVVAFYNNEVQNHPNLDPNLRRFGNGQPRRLRLTPEQQNEIIVFLKTLTDNQFLTDIKYSDPFRK